MTSKGRITVRKMVDSGFSESECSKSGFVATGRIASKMFTSEEHIGWRNVDFEPAVYPYRVMLGFNRVAKQGIPIIPSTTNKGEFIETVNEENIFINQLKLIADKSKSWGPYVFPSMVLLTSDDFDTIDSFIYADAT